MVRVIIASCHRSKNQMPARQTTVGHQRPGAAEDEGERGDRRLQETYHGDSASSDCIGLSSQLVT